MITQPIRRHLHFGCGEPLVSHVLDLFRQAARHTADHGQETRRESANVSQRKATGVQG